jgi:hypothetical protein
MGIQALHYYFDLRGLADASVNCSPSIWRAMVAPRDK